LWVGDINLSGASLYDTDLTGVHLYQATLIGTILSEADLTRAELGETNLTGADLWAATLTHADLSRADLTHANLSEAVLSGADLTGANLSGADLTGADLSGADLTGARMNVETKLDGAILSTTTRLADVIWNDAPLARVTWAKLSQLGDEALARKRTDAHGKTEDPHKHRSLYRETYETAARAYRLLVVALRSQGLNEHADRYAYRAQLCQQQALRLQKRWGQWLFVGLLWLLSGYGYRLRRILAAYGAVLVVFALLYAVLGVHSFRGESGVQALWDSFLVSLSAIHGRTTFEQLGAWTPAAWVAAVESVVGIVIEGVFVAMLVQRFFAR
jgi:uncharacterized protein YjbI with pentapeptide repeats